MINNLFAIEILNFIETTNYYFINTIKIVIIKIFLLNNVLNVT